MTKPECRPTELDFENQRAFCIIHLDASSDGLTARVVSRGARITKDRSGELRINPHGTIPCIELGQYQPHAVGAYCSSGVMIHYAEQEAELLKKAEKVLQKLQAKFLKNLTEHHRKISILEPQASS